MQRKVQTQRTSSLLQRASSQLKGERVASDPIRNEEDDLEAYIQSLSKKTGGKFESSTKYDDMGDISISTSEDTVPNIKQTAASKFMKKSSVDTSDRKVTSNKENIQSYSNRAHKRSEAEQDGSQYGARNKSSGQVSTTLNKAAILSGKITDRASKVSVKPVLKFEADSDDSFSVSKSGSSRHRRHDTASEDSLIKNGKKFLKKKQPEEHVEKEHTSKQMPTAKQQSVFKAPQPQPKSRSPSPMLRVPSPKYSAPSEDDTSLAGFVDEFSGSEFDAGGSHSRPHTRHGRRTPPRSPVQKSPTPDRSLSSSPSRSPVGRRNTPPARRRSPSNLQRSYSDQSLGSEYGDASSDGDFMYNVMEIDTLEPVVEIDATAIVTDPYKSKKKTKTVSYDDETISSKGKKKKKKKRKEKKSDVFSAFGLQTIDDLLGQTSANNTTGADDSVVSEIKTDGSLKFAAKPREYSISEVTSVHSDYSAKRHSYADDFEEEISEIIDLSGSEIETESVSEVLTKYSKEETVREYSETFETDTGANRSYSTDDETYSTYSDSRTLTNSEPVNSQIVLHRGDKGRQQTSAGHYAIMGPSYGLGFVDPTPIATHVVGADALEALTAYSPAMIAMHDMLRMQLDMTRQFIDGHKRMYDSYVESIESSHRYTTLQDTKKYIAKHRKPKLTFKEALRKVSKEMGK